jgi:hypothetical protein
VLHAAAAALLAASAASAAEVAQSPATFGEVEFVEGAVTVELPDGTRAAPKVGDKLLEGSTLITGADGELHVASEDAGYMALRPDTNLRLDTYRAEGGDDDEFAVTLFKGTFRSITGWIGRYNRDNYRIVTPTASVGIRGTDHEPRYVPEEDAAALGEEPGTYDKVNEGRTVLRNDLGQTEVAANQSGFVPLRQRLRPRLLARIPLFYRATRNEQRILVRRAVILKIMLKRRAERRAAWLKNHRKAAKKRWWQKKKDDADKR